MSLFLVSLLKYIEIGIEFNKFSVINIKANIKKAKLNINIGFIGIVKG